MTRVGRLIGILALVALASRAEAQTGVVMPSPVFEPDTNTGGICAGCRLYSYVAGTTTPQSVYTDSSLATPHSNPLTLDAAGRATVYLNPTLSYKFILRTSAGVEIWTRDNIVGPYSGVLSITTANPRGIQISRSGADAGLSIQSSGGSGKTYGIASTTGGALRIRDDSDGTPQIEISGNDITMTATGNVTVSGGALVANTANLGTTSVSSTLAVTGATTLNSSVSAGAGITSTSTAPQYTWIETDADTDDKRWDIVATSEALYLRTLNDAANTASTVFSVERTNTTVDSFTLAAAATLNTGRYNSATLQPGFLAYNSASDNAVATGATVDFDTEVYDEAGNFATDTFTAPVAGRYELCATVSYSDNAASSYGLRIVTSARSYRIGWSGAATADVSNGCVIADMSAGHTASVQVDTGDGTGITIEGGSSPLVTFFSGRLLP